ncbi:type II secretion system protein [Colwellia sp. Arc7-D]|uniref:type II secretion system protein n=1 Tax=Colwellia sp. Arc7-D TaxID=2161872 RepID=UPI000D3CB29C|nr:type II secretion system protein [Colwellia sp. Arc7-D]AWB59182.1 prepilin-type cleavage/methylation domain-containing protein [Colwellia sp. Arc7-D]
MNRRKSQGFTLIEMALVLVVIGIILGAVSVGMDMQRDAEIKKIKQKFVDGWASAYNQIYSRSGTVVGDNPAMPSKIVGAKKLDESALDTILDTGDYEEIISVCADEDEVNIQDEFKAAGIEMPQGRGVGNEDNYAYADNNGNPGQLTVCFEYMPPSKANEGSFASGNVMRITGMSADLAVALDTLIDGVPDSTKGMFRMDNSADKSIDTWPSIIGEDNESGNAAIARVEVIFKMNQ